MDNIVGAETEGRCDGALTGCKPADGLAGGKQLRASFFVDGGIHTVADDGHGIRCVDNGISRHGGNVISHDMKGHGLTSRVFVGFIVSDFDAFVNVKEKGFNAALNPFGN
jgi:hypothetical protein